jgi:hypothetical protein
MNSFLFLGAAASPSAPSSVFTGLLGAGLFMAIVCLIGGILLFLFPFIVMLQLAWLNSKLKAITDQHSAESTKNLQWSMTLASEVKTQNALTRQLLRAYGHEPEA